MNPYNFTKSLEKELLNLFGITKPTNKQLDLMRKLATQVSVSKQLLFDDRLTSQEKKCLFYAAHGYSTKETSSLLGCEIATIKYYREEIFRKFGCSNIAQAIFIGIRYGYLLPDDEKKLELCP